MFSMTAMREKLSSVVAPASINAFSTFGLLVAGPIVATIFVRRRESCSCIEADLGVGCWVVAYSNKLFFTF